MFRHISTCIHIYVQKDKKINIRLHTACKSFDIDCIGSMSLQFTKESQGTIETFQFSTLNTHNSKCNETSCEQMVGSFSKNFKNKKKPKVPQFLTRGNRGKLKSVNCSKKISCFISLHKLRNNLTLVTLFRSTQNKFLQSHWQRQPFCRDEHVFIRFQRPSNSISCDQ